MIIKLSGLNSYYPEAGVMFEYKHSTDIDNSAFSTLYPFLLAGGWGECIGFVSKSGPAPRGEAQPPNPTPIYSPTLFWFTVQRTISKVK